MMKHWSRNDRFAFFGVILTAIGVIGAVFPQEIRHMMGLDNGTPPAQSATLPAPRQPVPSQPDPMSPAPVTSSKTATLPASVPRSATELQISIKGDENTVTILATTKEDEETVGPVSVTGDSQANTYYLGKGKHAVINVMGDDNTLLLAPGVQSRVQSSVEGDGNKTQPYTENK